MQAALLVDPAQRQHQRFVIRVRGQRHHRLVVGAGEIAALAGVIHRRHRQGPARVSERPGAAGLPFRPSLQFAQQLAGFAVVAQPSQHQRMGHEILGRAPIQPLGKVLAHQGQRQAAFAPLHQEVGQLAGLRRGLRRLGVKPLQFRLNAPAVAAVEDPAQFGHPRAVLHALA